MKKISFPQASTVAVLLVLTVCRLSVAQTSWTPARVGSKGQDLNTVYFVDSKRGWVGGDGGYLARTEDGGQSWLHQTVGTKSAINDIYFRDKEAGFLLAGNTIFITRDEGTRWEVARSFAQNEFDGADVELYSVRFSS